MPWAYLDLLKCSISSFSLAMSGSDRSNEDRKQGNYIPLASQSIQVLMNLLNSLSYSPWKKHGLPTKASDGISRLFGSKWCVGSNIKYIKASDYLTGKPTVV